MDKKFLIHSLILDYVAFMIYFIYCIKKVEFAWTFIPVVMVLIYNQL